MIKTRDLCLGIESIYICVLILPFTSQVTGQVIYIFLAQVLLSAELDYQLTFLGCKSEKVYPLEPKRARAEGPTPFDSLCAPSSSTRPAGEKPLHSSRPSMHTQGQRKRETPFQKLPLGKQISFPEALS